MNISNCPHCGLKLGNFLYADACPHCHQELAHNNTRKLTATAQRGSLPLSTVFPLPLFRWFVRLVES
jgi:hypothetical protein